MIPKINLDPNKKISYLFIVEEEEVNSTEGKIQWEKEMSNMDSKDEFIVLYRICWNDCKTYLIISSS